MMAGNTCHDEHSTPIYCMQKSATASITHYSIALRCP
jgi:short-subunit dehydrogenase involved in D-alanine esterification of teichoic acids